MNEKTSDAIIRLCGLFSMAQAVFFGVGFGSGESATAPMNLLNALIFVPPFYLLGWRVCAKRLRAGICLALFVRILCSNFITSREAFSLLAGFNFILFIALTLMLTLFSSRWKRTL